MSRKDTLKAMLTRRTEELPHGDAVSPAPELPHGNFSPEAEPELPAPPSPVPHVRSGAVGAMGRSLGQIANAAERAKALVASGAAVVEIPADKLVGSFAQDRLDDEGADYEALYTAIKEVGQKSPILVRPLPDRPDFYQIAYGHRRAKILEKLGRPVRAVVQALSDEELVVIQGQENSARKDLSYIERGLFAVTLEEQGFDRNVIMSALSMEKTQLSRLMALTKSIPRRLVLAIGPAPKAGRPRWTALSERLDALADVAHLDELLADPKFQQADTDQRFVRVFNATAPKSTASSKPSRAAVTTDAGDKIATVERAADKVTIVVDADGSREFGEYLADRLPELYRQFEEGKEGAA